MHKMRSDAGAILQSDSLHFQESLYSEIRQIQRERKIQKLNPEASLSEQNVPLPPNPPKPRVIEITPKHSNLLSRIQRVNDGDTVILAPGTYDFASTLHVVASHVSFVSPTQESIFRFNHLDGDGVMVAGRSCIFKGISFCGSLDDVCGASNFVSCVYGLVSVISGASVDFTNCEFSRSTHAYSLITTGPHGVANMFQCRLSTQRKGAILATLQSSIAIDDSIIMGTDSISSQIGILIENQSDLRMIGTEFCGFASISVLIASRSSATLKKCKSISHHQRDALCAHGVGTRVHCTECQFSNSIEANVAALFGAHVEAENCHFIGGMFQGCVVQGAGSALHLRHCVTRETNEACVSVSRGGHFAAVDSLFLNSKEMQGIAAQGPGSSVELLNCKIVSCRQTCVLALSGAIMSLFDCEIMNSKLMQGVCAEGSCSTINMVRCCVKGTKEACVVAMHGGTVKLENCSLSNSISSRGLSVEGPESSAILIDCKIKNCATAAICVLSAAKIKIHGGTFSDCKSAEGQGMCVQGGGTKAEIFDACFAR